MPVPEDPTWGAFLARRIWIGIGLVAAASIGGIINAVVQIRSCDIDELATRAPAGAGSVDPHRQWPYLGCVTEYGMTDGTGATIVMPPFDWTWPLLILFAAGIATFATITNHRAKGDS